MNLLASTVTAVLVTGLLGVVSASPSSAAVGCTPIAIMAARGSGEKAVSSTEYGRGVRTNGWEGPTLARLLRGYTASPFFTSKLRAVPVIGVSESDGYRAVGVNPLFEGIGSRVKPSADAGVGAALGRINAFQRSQPATCPKTKWVLIGYSQGAMVTRGVTSAAPGRIGMVFNAGDPYQLPRQTQNIGTGSAGIGIFRYKFLSLADELDAYYVDAPEGSVSLCHAFDTVCDVSGDPLPHLNYFKSARERARSGDRLAREVDSLLTASTVDPGAPAKVANDVVFAIDTTASMSDLIGTAVANADAIGRSVVASAERGRVGLVEYRDHGDEFVARRVVPLTRDVDAFSAGLNTLTADGGGDTPEAVYSGIVTAAGSEWAGGASRSIVVIGDAPAHDPEDVTGYTSSQMAALLRGETPASALRQGKRAETPSRSVVAADGATSLYGLVADGELQSQLSTVTAGSGGTVYDIGVDGSAAELLTTVVDETALAPRANLRSSAAVAGFETTVSALDSVVPRGPGTFDFDLDDDGIFEVTGSEPTRGVVFNSPGNYLVSVRITDSDGRTSTATSTVAVSARAALEGGPVPGDPATAITGVSAPRRAYPGLVVRLKFDKASLSGSSFVRASLVRAFRPPLAAPRYRGSFVPANSGVVRLRVPATTPRGAYRIELVTEAGRYGSGALRVLREPTQVRATVLTKRIRPGQRPRVRVRLMGTVRRPTGRVTVRSGRRLVGRKLLRAERPTRLALSGFKKAGRHTVIVRFRGNRVYAPSWRRVAFTVTRR